MLCQLQVRILTCYHSIRPTFHVTKSALTLHFANCENTSVILNSFTLFEPINCHTIYHVFFSFVMQAQHTMYAYPLTWS